MTVDLFVALREPELVNLAGVNTGRDALSHTSIGTYLTCEQRFAYHYEERLSTAITATPLAMGKAFAHAVEHGDPDAGHAMLLEQAAKEAEASEGNPWVNAPDDREVLVQATIVREASRAYLKQYGSHDTREVEMRARVRNPAVGGRYSQSHDLLGRVDALSPDGRVLIEDKLVGQIPRASLAAKVKLDRQVTIGCYLHWRTTGQVIETIRYRMTLKPAIRQTKKESFEAYLERIAEEYATRAEHYLVEEEAHRDAADFLRLERELWRWAEQIRESRRDGTWPRNVAACHDPGRSCQFVPLCVGEPGAAHQFVTRPVREEVAA